MVRTIAGLGVCVVLFTLLPPPMASAQQASASGIAGVVRDTSGAVLPGVTVEASSPALIEKTRSVTTDSEGRYNIIDLRPGIYLVTFSLSGFNVFRRDGIELTSGFTATVNADMQVGALTETITVTGESPLVDTRNARKQITVTDDLLNVLPSSVKNLNNLVTLTPGFRGNEGFDVTGAYSGQIGGTFHGKGATNVQFDGMGIQHASGNQGYNANAETVQELVMYTTGISADGNADGAIVNMIPKEGGQHVLGQRLRPLLQRQPDERQPERRADRPRHEEREPPQLHLRCGLHAGWSDQEGPALVLRLVSRVGQQAAGGQQVLQRHAAYTVLHSGPFASRVRQGVVRVESHSRDAGGQPRRTSSTSSPTRSATATAPHSRRADR